METGLHVNASDDMLKNQFADAFLTTAIRAMLQEVSATPKPGLVDRENTGSHHDMGFSLS